MRRREAELYFRQKKVLVSKGPLARVMVDLSKGDVAQLREAESE